MSLHLIGKETAYFDTKPKFPCPEPAGPAASSLRKNTAPAEDLFRIERSKPHGHVEALLGFIRHLGVDKLISSTPYKEWDLVLAMIVEQILHGAPKLASTCYWHATTLAEDLRLKSCDEDDLYEALDWLLERQGRIEDKLAARHLREGPFALYDVSAGEAPGSYYEGRTCPLSEFGHNKDGKRGKEIIVYGLLTNAQGCPVGMEVYPGNTSDPKRLADQAYKLKDRFCLKEVTLVSDRDLLTQARIDALKAFPGINHLSALRSTEIRGLVEDGDLRMSLFDTRNLREIASPDFPGERLIACFNPLLAAERKRKRRELLEATEKSLSAIEKEIARRTQTPLSAEAFLSFSRNAESIARVELAFRSLKGIDLRVRPIRHRTEDHVLPEGIPIRQWVLTLPQPLHYPLAFDGRHLSRGGDGHPAGLLRPAPKPACPYAFPGRSLSSRPGGRGVAPAGPAQRRAPIRLAHGPGTVPEPKGYQLNFRLREN